MMIRKVLLPLAIIFGIAILVIAADFVLRPRTPVISGPAPVHRLEQVQLGHTRQWVLTRGTDRHRTILLFLHGGPGMPTMYLAHAFERPLEQDFVVVQWDRRGAGKSYAAGEGWQPNVRDILNDLHQLARILHQRFPDQRLILVGHSWGTYLGMLAIRERPDLYDAYVGTGQLAGDTDDDARERIVFFRSEAIRRGDKAMLAKLANGYQPNENDLFRYDAEIVGTHSFLPILWLGLTAPEYTFRDVMNVPKGAQQLDREMRYNVVSGPLDKAVTSVSVPVFFFLGKHDWNTPSNLAAAYLRQLKAPAKGLVWFDHSAHFPFLEEPQKFAREMQKVDAWLAAAAHNKQRSSETSRS